MLPCMLQDLLVERLCCLRSMASVACPTQRLLLALNAGATISFKRFDVHSIAASAARVAVGATKVKTPTLTIHVPQLVAGESRAGYVFLANITMEWAARDARARVVHKKIAVLLFAASAASVAVGATEVSILLLITHVMQLAAGESRAW